MTEEVRAYMNTKTDYLYENFEVSGACAQAVQQFEQELEKIAERSATPQDFETAYANGGYYLKFYDLTASLPVRNRSLTKEEKQAVRATFRENREEIRKFSREETKRQAKEKVKRTIEDAPMTAAGLAGYAAADELTFSHMVNPIGPMMRSGKTWPKT